MPVGNQTRSRQKKRGSPEEPESGTRSKTLLNLGPYAGIGMVLFVSVLGGTVGGIFLDRWLGSTPWLTLLGIFLGMGAGFVSLFRTLHEQELHRRRLVEHQGTDKNDAGS